MGILDGGIANLFAGAFGSFYLDGLSHTGTSMPIYAGGRIVGYTDPGDIAIKVQTDTTSDAIKASAGYVAGDAMLIVLTRTPAGVELTLTTDGQITDGYGTRYRLMDCDQDAARSHWICRGREV